MTARSARGRAAAFLIRGPVIDTVLRSTRNTDVAAVIVENLGVVATALEAGVAPKDVVEHVFRGKGE